MTSSRPDETDEGDNGASVSAEEQNKESKLFFFILNNLMDTFEARNF